MESLEGRQLLTATLTSLPPLPSGVVVGRMESASDGSLWGTLSEGPAGLLHVSPTGQVTDVPLPSGDAWGTITGLTPGADGSVWFSYETADRTLGKVGQARPDGTLTEFALPQGTLPGMMTTRPDGTIWLAESVPGGTALARVSSAGIVSQTTVSEHGIQDLTAGPDGTIWFSDDGRIGKMAPNGAVTDFSVSVGNPIVGSMKAGPDGNLWFLSPGGIGHVTPTGQIRTYRTPSVQPTALAFGQDGTLWFAGETTTSAASYPVRLGKLLPNGAIKAASISPAALTTVIMSMSSAPDGQIWLDEGGISLARFNPEVSTSSASDSTGPSATTNTATVDYSGAVVSFATRNSAIQASELQAEINWGDGTTSPGTVQATGSGQLEVLGNHVFNAQPGSTISISVKLTGPGGRVKVLSNSLQV